jgi:hypothetical protein
MALKFVRKMKTFNRRKHIRLNVNCLVHYWFPGANAPEKILTYFVVLSAGGVLLNTFQVKLDLKSNVEIEFQIPGHDKPLHAKGVVMRVTKKTPKSFRAGVKFEEISRHDLDQLNDFFKQSSRRK